MVDRRRSFLRWGASIAASGLLLPGCAPIIRTGSNETTTELRGGDAAPEGAENVLPTSNWARQSGVLDVVTQQAMPQTPGSHWFHYPLPGKRVSRYVPVQVNGREALAVHADASASMIRRRVWVAANRLNECRFSWRVPDLLNKADMAQADLDDAPVRVGLVFDGDRSRFSARNAVMSELSLALTGEPLPYAVLMYVWSKHRPTGDVVHNPRSDRIRKLVVESGFARQDQWLDYRRNIRADFQQAFGEAPGPLIGISLMSDTDNTRSLAQPWYGTVQVSVLP